MPFIDFTAGDVLTAAQMDTTHRQGVMTFASAAARTTALTGVLNEGMVVYLEDTNRTEVYDGLNWVTVSSPWTAYTPGLTNAVLGNGVLDFRYRYTGWKTIRVRGVWTLGSTSSISGLVGFSYPDSVTPDTAPRAIGHAWLIDDTGSDFVGSCQAGATIAVYSAGIVSTSATSPFTWATSDVISVDIEFEIN